MDKTTYNSGFKLGMVSIGKAIMYLYFIMAYVSCSNVVSSSWNSITLYAFVAIGVFCFFRRNRGVIKRFGYVTWYGLFMILSIVSALVSSEFYLSYNWQSVISEMVAILLICIAIEGLVESKQDIRNIGYASIIGAVALLAILSVTGNLYIDERLGTTATGNANTFATMYMVAFIYAIWRVCFTENQAERIITLVAVVVIMYGLFLSGGRKFIIVPIILLYIILLLKRDSKGRKHILRNTAIVAAIIALLIYLMMNVSMLYDIVGHRMILLWNAFIGKGEIGASNAIRESLRNLAFVEGFNSPVVGHGFNSFYMLAGKELNYAAYAHNNWAEMWYDGGILFLIVYYVFYFRNAWTAWIVGKGYQEEGIFAFSVFVALFIFEYGCVTYYQNQIQIMLCLASLLLRVAENDYVDCNDTGDLYGKA